MTPVREDENRLIEFRKIKNLSRKKKIAWIMSNIPVIATCPMEERGKRDNALRLMPTFVPSLRPPAEKTPVRIDLQASKVMGSRVSLLGYPRTEMQTLISSTAMSVGLQNPLTFA